MKKLYSEIITRTIATVHVFAYGFGISRTDFAFRTPGTLI
ncbi:hypothetical protein SAMN04487760_10627 [Lachnospiraceae bacterium G41]|nr:hypothetical protein SAMN04487760_10627 [Lachnospiraceae bacterium G41]